MLNEEEDRLEILNESFSVLDGYYFISNDLNKKELNYDILILESLIKYFKYCNDNLIVKDLEIRLKELNNFIK